MGVVSNQGIRRYFGNQGIPQVADNQGIQQEFVVGSLGILRAFVAGNQGILGIQGNLVGYPGIPDNPGNPVPIRYYWAVKSVQFLKVDFEILRR